MKRLIMVAIAMAALLTEGAQVVYQFSGAVYVAVPPSGLPLNTVVDGGVVMIEGGLVVVE